MANYKNPHYQAILQMERQLGWAKYQLRQGGLDHIEAAGRIISRVEDMAITLSAQIADDVFNGRAIVAKMESNNVN